MRPVLGIFAGVVILTIGGKIYFEIREEKLLFGDYQASVTFVGVEASYPEGEWLSGEIYQESTAMPYLVLNEAAVKAFTNEKKQNLQEAGEVDWDSQSLILEGEKYCCGSEKNLLRQIPSGSAWWMQGLRKPSSAGWKLWDWLSLTMRAGTKPEAGNGWGIQRAFPDRNFREQHEKHWTNALDTGVWNWYLYGGIVGNLLP